MIAKRSAHHRETARRAALTALLALCLVGCGAEGTEAPRVDAPQALCPTVDEHLSDTLAALRAGKAQNLANTLDLMEVARPDAAQGLLGAVLAIAGEVWRSGLREDTSLLTDLGALLDGLTPLLTSIIDHLAREGAVQRDALEAVSGLLATCPQRALTDAAALLVSRPELVGALGDLVEDPLVVSVIESLSDGGQSGREGFVALFRTIIRALNSPNFVFADLTALIEPLFDLDAPPFDVLVAELELLLTAENLVTVRALTVCLDQQIVVASGRTGTEALGALVYDLITDPQIRLGERLGELEPALEVLDDPRVRAALDAILGRLQSDEAVREGLKPGIRFLLAPEHVSGVLSDASALIQAGLLPDVIGLLTDVLEPCTVEAP